MSSATAPTISSTGITAPTFAQILAYFTAQYQSIFGSDVYLGNDSQDGQLLAIFSQACADNCAAVIAAYGSFSPATAQGTGLSSVVKINGLARLAPSFSTAPVTLTGVGPVTITNGQVQDGNGNLWNLPASASILTGQTTAVVSATAVNSGAVQAAVGAAQILTPVSNWTGAAIGANTTTGTATETDAALRLRQSNSTSAPALTVFDAIWDAIEAISGVTRVWGYENNTASANGNGVPAYSLAFIVEGGLQSLILQAIAGKVTPGIPTFGTTSGTIIDANGASRAVAYSICAETTVNVVLTLKRLTGWSTSIEPVIQAAIVAYVTSLPIGVSVSYFGVIGAALAALTQYPSTYEITAMTLNGATTDVAIAWNAAGTTAAGNITFVLT